MRPGFFLLSIAFHGIVNNRSAFFDTTPCGFVLYHRPMFFRAYFWSSLFAVALCSSSAFGGLLSARGGADLPIRIKADSLNYYDTIRTYSARGNVVITWGDQSLWADAVDLNAQTMKTVAWGNPRFTSGEDWFTGTRVEIDLGAGTGTLYDGTLFIKESHFYVKGNKIEKIGEDTYHIASGSFTTCDADSPAWKITGKELNVAIDGYGTMKHATFWTSSVPILYAPFLVFPAKVRRQTGLLVPQISCSSRNGFEYNQPFFWAINKSSDATLYEDYMADRGLKHGVEYRYVLGAESKGAVMYDFLRDRQVDDKDRWWLRMKTDQGLPLGFKAKLDVDVVSDQYYLREFKKGYSSFESSKFLFHKEFGRALDVYTDTTRLNQLNLNRDWGQYSLNADLRWYDNVIIRENHDPDRTLQNLPSIQFDGSKQTLFATPLYFDLESSYDHFWRDHGARGHRADLHPRLYYPTRLCRCLDFEPSVGLRETIWHIDEHEDETSGEKDRWFSREVFDCKADLSTQFSRVFHVNGESLDRIKHAVMPRVVYDYVPVPEQEDYPYFDGLDRIEEKNIVTYSVTNYFTARSIKEHNRDLETRPGSLEGPGAPLYDYHDFCRIKIAQSYDIREARRNKEGGSRRPFSDIKGELQFIPHDCLDLDGDATWSPYDGEFKSYNAIVALYDRRGDHASMDYRYTQGGIRSIIAKLFVKLTDGLSVYWENERNIEEGEDIETIIGFIYESQCWSLGFNYTYDGIMDDQQYFVQVNLYGLGQVGK